LVKQYPVWRQQMRRLHFKKLECFCFVKQEFQPGEEVEMALRFVVEPEMAEWIKDVSLSYNFYKLDS